MTEWIPGRKSKGMIVVENIEKVISAQLVYYLTSLFCAVFIVKNLLTKNDGNIFRPEI